MNIIRTHNCNELNVKNLNEEVRIMGWLHSIRNHGGLIFLDIRDYYGITQCVINEKNPNLIEQANKIKLETVVSISGKVLRRLEDTINPNIDTGEIEVLANKIIIESPAEVLPFSVSLDDGAGEEIRLKYRFLDLRREKMQKMLKFRSDAINFIRNKMLEADFTEVQTPILTGSSPEGARDFLVPSRKHYGKFYALPQAPQIFKQLLMVGGLNKYFQIAPCFRDEDARADRTAGEFYQLDFEMSFVKQEDVLKVAENMFYSLFSNFTNKKVTNIPFPIISYNDSIKKYATDKPDLRNPLEIFDATEMFKNSNFTLFANLIAKGAKVNAIPAPLAANQPRSFFDKLNDWAKKEKQGGLGYIIFDKDDNKGPIAGKLTTEELKNIQSSGKLQKGDAVFFVCGKGKEFIRFSGLARNKIAEELDLVEKDVFKMCFIVDFPLFELDDNGKLDFSHNPFSMPIGGMEALEKEDPLKINAYQYDVVCNGVEVCSGAIRNHRLDIMYKVFDMAGYSKEDVENKFNAFVAAFKYGAPPHGGAAFGIDRILMLLSETANIRDIIAFPLNQSGEDLLMKAPSEVEQSRLSELGIKIDLKKHKMQQK